MEKYIASICFLLASLVERPDNGPEYAYTSTGGTVAPWDDVRWIGNQSKGGFGVELANSFANRGIPTILLCTEIARLKYPVHPSVIVITYETFDQYMTATATIARLLKGRFRYAVSAAAVSDYAPEKIDGKIDSKEEIAPKMVKLPKVLANWREWFGIGCYLVGFKLHAYPTVREGDTVRAPNRREYHEAMQKLFAAADQQIRSCHLNMTCANFAPWTGNIDTMRGQKRLWIRRPDGGKQELLGTNHDVATALIDYVIAQADVTWGKSVRTDGDAALFRNDLYREGFVLAERSLAFAKDARLLKDRSGNLMVCVNSKAAQAWVTPRGVDKSLVQPEDLALAVMPNRDDREVHFTMDSHTGKPSIDTRVYLMVKRMFPFVAAIHFHDGWVFGDVERTEHDFACGTNKAAGELLMALTRTRKRNGLASTIVVELVGHGHTLFIVDDERRQIARLEEDWAYAKNMYIEHLKEVGRTKDLEYIDLTPIFWRGTARVMIAGVVARHRETSWHSFFVLPEYRKTGIGAQIVERINERVVQVAVHKNCEVEAFYLDRGFKIVERWEEEGLTIFDPPCLRDDLREAAVLRITCPSERAIALVLRPPTGSFPEVWGNPGGKREFDKKTRQLKPPFKEACREGVEEIDADLSMFTPSRTTVHYTRFVRPDGREEVFRVECNHVEVPWCFPLDSFPQTGEIADARWFGYGELRDLPRSHATKETQRDLR